MLEFKITVYDESEKRSYSWTEEYSQEDIEEMGRKPECGTFNAPFDSDNPAIGWYECLYQSDSCPPVFYEKPIHKIVVEKIS